MATELTSAATPLVSTIDSMVTTQIQRGVSTTHSSDVLIHLIDALAQTAIAQTTDNAARTFTQNLSQLLDDSVVWMDALQVSSTASSSVDLRQVQQQVQQRLQNKVRQSGSSYCFDKWWTAEATEAEQTDLVRTCLQCLDVGCDDAIITTVTDSLTRTLQSCVASHTRTEASAASWSLDQICDLLTGSIRSCTEAGAETEVKTTVTPAFITNYCVYKQIFQKRLDANCTSSSLPCSAQLGGVSCPSWGGGGPGWGGGGGGGGGGGAEPSEEELNRCWDMNTL
jgi:hypothetical protein